MRHVKFSVSLLALSAFVFAACDTPTTRRSLYSPQTPGKNQGTFSVILREQSYLKGIDSKDLRPWTVKKKDQTTGAPGLPSAPLKPDEGVARPEVQ